eukprot:2805426-Prymnesium_polylepis.1
MSTASSSSSLWGVASKSFIDLPPRNLPPRTSSTSVMRTCASFVRTSSLISASVCSTAAKTLAKRACSALPAS